MWWGGGGGDGCPNANIVTRPLFIQQSLWEEHDVFIGPLPHYGVHTRTPYGCNKAADHSHWLLTGTDTETCCCWMAAWEMFITHRACRFGQERNSGLIKWRPGAAGGETHARPRGLPRKLGAVASTERSGRLREEEWLFKLFQQIR